MRNQLKSVAWVAALLCAGIVNAQNAEVIRRGKQATALVVVKQGTEISSGTAFCVSSDGFFITNAHVIPESHLQQTIVRTGSATVVVPGRGVVVVPRGRIVTRSVATTLSLVINPGETNQQVYTAHVAKLDRTGDLAALFITPKQPLPILELGKVDALVETSPVTAFGYPFGQMLAEKGEYPNVSVSVGRVTSLRKSRGELSAIQLDASLNPGNSGGPVLDDKGRVVGIVEKYIPGAALNFSIPVTKLAQFLESPVAALSGPTVDPENATKPMEFTIRLLALGAKGMPGAKVDLELSNDQGPVRKFAATKVKDNVYKVMAAMLAEVKESGNPATAPSLDAAPPPTPAAHAVQFAVVVKRAGIEDARTEGKITVALSAAEKARRGAVASNAASGAASTPEPQRPAVDTPPAAAVAEGDHQVLKLPAQVSSITTGGGGRYIILWMPQTRQLGILDAKTKKIDFIGLDTDDICYAASSDKLFIVLRKAGTIERWGLATHRKELSKPLANAEVVSSIGVGESSVGPLFVAGRGNIQLLNIGTLAPAQIQVEVPGVWKDWLATGSGVVTTSADGKTFAVTENSTIRLVTITGKTAQAITADRHVGFARPNTDGSLIICQQGILDAKLSPIKISTWEHLWIVPVHSSAYFFGIDGYNSDNPQRIGLFAAGDHSLLLTLPPMKEITANETQGPQMFDRLHVIPSLNLMVNLDPTAKRLIIRDLDIGKLLAASGNDYLFVTSVPPRISQLGAAYEYQIEVTSKQGGVKFTLESGPPGMTVSPTGKITWRAAAPANREPIPVIVLIKDKSGREIYHNFKLWPE